MVKRYLVLAELHKDAHLNMCSKLLGRVTGMRLEAWTCKYLGWFVLPLAMCFCVAEWAGSVPTLILTTTTGLLPAGLIFGCQRVSVLNALVRNVPSVWYYAASVITGRICDLLIFGQRF